MVKVYTNFDFAEFPDSSIVADSLKLEYIKEFINLTHEDKKSVYPYAVFNVGVIVFVFGDMLNSISALAVGWKLSAIFGLVLLASSSVFFFWYWRKIHRCHISLVSCIPALNIVKAKEAWITLWSDNKILFKFGLSAMIVGIILSSLAFLALLG